MYFLKLSLELRIRTWWYREVSGLCKLTFTVNFKYLDHPPGDTASRGKDGF